MFPGEKPFVFTSQLYNYYIDNTNDNFTTLTKFGLFLSPVVTRARKGKNGEMVYIFDKKAVQEYFQRKGITIEMFDGADDDNDPESTGTQIHQKEIKQQNQQNLKKSRTQICPTINENEKVDILVTETIKRGTYDRRNTKSYRFKELSSGGG